MNNERRKTAAAAYAKMEDALRLLQHVENEENEALLNMPSNLASATVYDPAKGYHSTNRTSGITRNRAMEIGSVRAQLSAAMKELKDIVDGK